MIYLFSKHILLRAPVKRPEDYPATNQLFLEDPVFRSAVYLASPAFFSTLERHNFQAGNLTEKEVTTLRKYINRYCFRPIPFGLFASVSLIRWTADPNFEDTEQNTFIASLQISQACQILLGQDLMDHELKEHTCYEGNPSLYRFLNEYRFFRTSLDENVEKRDYMLQSIAFSRLLKDLLAWTGEGRTLKEIACHIAQAAECTLTAADEYADFLVDAQLLVSRLRPNITGISYINRLAHQPQLLSSKKQSIIAQILTSLATTPLRPDALDELNSQLKRVLTGQQAALQNNQLNVILQKTSTNPGLETCYQDSLRDGLYALDRLSAADRIPAMDRFITIFQQHFEGQTIPLLNALDPETGIGYQDETPEQNNALLETLHLPYKAKPASAEEWSAARSLLLKCWLRDNQGQRMVINLGQEDLKKLKAPDDQPFLGMSVLFRIIDKHVFIENAGGSNAPALMGRFSVGNEAITEAAREMARHVEKQNPHLIFAELLHLADPHVDNVNQRQCFYRYELPIIAVSTQPKDRQLELSDLYVRMEQHKVVLFSKKHGKAVVPRLSSAYNHSLNKLPLFRFLADLPYQYSRFNLSLDLRQYFPDQDFYPRVVYRKAILCLATWIISDRDLEDLQAQSISEAVSAFKRLSQKIHLPDTFSLVEGDQQLVFNQHEDADLYFFCSCIRQKKELLLQEFLPQPEIRQYNAYLLPANPLTFPSRQNRIPANSLQNRRKYIPGSEWLYLKIYAPRFGAARLLLRLQPLLVKRYPHGKISKWFFIRYDDHAPHIRLRLKVVPEDISAILMAFKVKLEDRIQQHVIREYQIDVYSRELERYAAAGIELTEDFFWASSELVMSHLKLNRSNLSANAPYFPLLSTQVIIRSFMSGLDDQAKFCFESYELFLPEFAEGRVKVALDKRYRQLSTGIQTAMKTDDPGLLSGSAKAGERFAGILKELDKNVPPAHPERMGYIRSIIHMHLNRLFTDESRKQEMITYYLLYKYLLSVRGRQHC